MTTSTFEGRLKIILGCTTSKGTIKRKKTEGPAATCFSANSKRKEAR